MEEYIMLTYYSVGETGGSSVGSYKWFICSKILKRSFKEILLFHFGNKVFVNNSKMFGSLILFHSRWIKQKNTAFRVDFQYSLLLRLLPSLLLVCSFSLDFRLRLMLQKYSFEWIDYSFIKWQSGSLLVFWSQ